MASYQNTRLGPSIITLALLLIASSQCFSQSDIEFPQYMQELCRNNSLKMFKQTLLRTPRNNELYVLGITSAGDSSKNQYRHFLGSPAVVLTSVMHVREDTSFRFLKLALEHVVKQYAAGNHQLKYLLERTVLLVMPFVNIDAVMYGLTISGDKLQQLRKNMNQGKFDNCPISQSRGVDINRNFGYNFGTQSTSKDPCSEEYRGVTPFSEPQSQSLQMLFKDYQVIANVDIHSYGNIWIYPYASHMDPDKIKQHALYLQYELVFKQLEQMNISFDNCYRSLKYVADGVYIDWALEKGSLSFALEFGDDFTLMGKHADQHIAALMAVLLTNVNAFQWYLSVSYVESGARDEEVKLCVKSFCSIEHNVILAIGGGVVEGKRLPAGGDACFSTDVTSLLQLHESSGQQSGDQAKVQVKLGQSGIRKQIHLNELTQSSSKTREKQPIIWRIYSQFKYVIICAAILCGIGCLCGLSIFFENSLGTRTADQETNRLSGTQLVHSRARIGKGIKIMTSNKWNSLTPNQELVDPEHIAEAQTEEAHQFEDK